MFNVINQLLFFFFAFIQTKTNLVDVYLCLDTIYSCIVLIIILIYIKKKPMESYNSVLTLSKKIKFQENKFIYTT